MKNFFSSPLEADYQNFYNKLKIILSELRHQRQDNVQILFLLNKLLTDRNLQKQVDEYFDETSPQTEPETPTGDLD